MKTIDTRKLEDLRIKALVAVREIDGYISETREIKELFSNFLEYELGNSAISESNFRSIHKEAEQFFNIQIEESPQHGNRHLLEKFIAPIIDELSDLKITEENIRKMNLHTTKPSVREKALFIYENIDILIKHMEAKSEQPELSPEDKEVLTEILENLDSAIDNAFYVDLYDCHEDLKSAYYLIKNNPTVGQTFYQEVKDYIIPISEDVSELRSEQNTALYR